MIDPVEIPVIKIYVIEFYDVFLFTISRFLVKPSYLVRLTALPSKIELNSSSEIELRFALTTFSRGCRSRN